jgi:purine-binding chemotaxis protein CheW
MSEFKQYVRLLLAEDKYGIDIMDIEEILRMVDITTVPKAPSFVEGIINLRGRVIPIVDLRKKMGLMASDFTNATRIIVVNLSGRKIGFIVDNVEDVLRVSSDVVDKAPSASTGADTKYIQGVAKTEQGMVIILDVHKVFSTGESSALNMF